MSGSQRGSVAEESISALSCLDMNLSIAQAVAEGGQVLHKAGVPEARRDAALLLGHVMGCGQGFMITHAGDALSTEVTRKFQEFVARRASGEPLQYITGHQSFFNLDFEVTKDVLIPRPETELLIEVALDLLPLADHEAFICDLGTGSGCIAITLLHERPRARALGIDISLPALCIAKKNSDRLGVSDRYSLAASDCFGAIESSALFSMVVSNPPYIAEDAFFGLQREVRDHEPQVALQAGTDGLAVIRRLLEQAPPYLTARGYFLFEIGFDHHEVVQSLINRGVWDVLDIHKDLQGIPRTVVLRKK